MRYLATTLTALALCACAHAPGSAPQPEPPRSEALHALFDEYWEEHLALNPLAATFVGDPRYNDRLPNTLAPEYRAQTAAFHRRWLARIEAFDPQRLNADDRLSYEIFRCQREHDIAGERFPDHLVPVNQFRNLGNLMAQFGSGQGAQPFATADDYDNWLARAARVPVLFDQAIANMREGVQQGVVQPRVLMEKVLPQLAAHIVDDPEQSLFYRPVTTFPEAVAAPDRDRLQALFRSLIAETLVPAYRRLHDFIRDEYLPHTRTTYGVNALPDGEAWYAHLARQSTTTDLTPQKIHRIGLDEVERIHGAMRRVMRQVGFEGDLQAFFAFLDTDPRFVFDSEADLLAAYEALRERVDAHVDALFSLQPRAGYEIRAVEPFRAASAAGGSYMRPSADGSRPGIFYVNTYDLPSRKSWAVENLFLHEAVPGHHFQIALQQELEDVPMFRRFASVIAFSEGWALYAESLGPELGVYEDPYSYFGYLQAELWRAIRLVVDTGLHAKGWTRQQVIDYMRANSAVSRTRAVSEAERYMAIPGQALAYKIGELKIRELRARAEAALGEHFDIRAFHTEVLRDGALPLDVLEDTIERWISGLAP